MADKQIFDLSVLAGQKEELILPVSKRNISIKPLTALNVKEMFTVPSDATKEEAEINRLKTLDYIIGEKFTDLCLADSEYVLLHTYFASTDKATEWTLDYKCTKCESDIITSYAFDDVTATLPPSNIIKAGVVTLYMNTPNIELLDKFYEALELTDTVDGVVCDIASQCLSHIMYKDVAYEVDDFNGLLDKLPYTVISELHTFLSEQQTIKTDVSIECSCGEKETHTLLGITEHVV